LVVSAQDDDTPVDPATFEGNWCDEGGKWYDPVEYAPFTSRCEAQPDEWSRAFMWANGWYGALYDAGGITLGELLELAPTIAGNIITINHPNFLLPETPAPVVASTEVSVPTSDGCMKYNENGFGKEFYINFGGGYFITAPVAYYTNDNTCTGTPWYLTKPVVYAPTGYDALTLCNLNGSFSSASPASNVNPDVYWCEG
jgi:hypothetical protein